MTTVSRELTNNSPVVEGSLLTRVDKNSYPLMTMVLSSDIIDFHDHLIEAMFDTDENGQGDIFISPSSEALHVKVGNELFTHQYRDVALDVPFEVNSLGRIRLRIVKEFSTTRGVIRFSSKNGSEGIYMGQNSLLNQLVALNHSLLPTSSGEDSLIDPFYQDNYRDVELRVDSFVDTCIGFFEFGLIKPIWTNQQFRRILNSVCIDSATYDVGDLKIV